MPDVLETDKIGCQLGDVILTSMPRGVLLEINNAMTLDEIDLNWEEARKLRDTLTKILDRHEKRRGG